MLTKTIKRKASYLFIFLYNKNQPQQNNNKKINVKQRNVDQLKSLC